MKKEIKISIAMLCCCIFTASAQTSTGTDNTRKSNQMNSMSANSDEDFVREALKTGKKEVKMGNMGKTKASNMRVKNFATMMVRDHTKANEELKSIAAKKNMMMTDDDMAMTGKDKSMMEKNRTMDDKNKSMSERNDHMDHGMKNKTGAAFDREFMDMMVDGHKKAVDLFEKESNSGMDEEIKAFATKTLPTLRMHLDSATTIQSSLMNSRKDIGELTK